jgi:hypothetical protein
MNKADLIIQTETPGGTYEEEKGLDFIFHFICAVLFLDDRIVPKESM